MFLNNLEKLYELSMYMYLGLAEDNKRQLGELQAKKTDSDINYIYIWTNESKMVSNSCNSDFFFKYYI